MLHFIFDTVFGWIGVAGLVVIGCIAVGYFIPGFRLIAIEIAGVVISAATIYTKGSRDRAALEQKRKDEAVRKAQKDYAEINARPDNPDTVSKRFRDGSF